MDFRAMVRSIPDFPEPGILFRDLTTLWKDPAAFRASVDAMAAPFLGQGIDLVVGAESRGFIPGAALAYALGCGFVPARKAGKLPAETLKEVYSLEYGEAALEIHTDAIVPGRKVLIADDVLATGGTAKAMLSLVRKLGGEVAGFIFLAELKALDGRSKLDCRVESLIVY